MSLLDKLEVMPTGFQDIDGHRMNVALREIQEVSPPFNFDLRDEYEMRVRIGTKFRANSAEYKHCYREAKRILNHHIYGDIVGRLHSLKNEIWFETDKVDLINRVEKLINDIEKGGGNNE